MRQSHALGPFGSLSWGAISAHLLVYLPRKTLMAFARGIPLESLSLLADSLSGRFSPGPIFWCSGASKYGAAPPTIAAFSARARAHRKRWAVFFEHYRRCLVLHFQDVNQPSRGVHVSGYGKNLLRGDVNRTSCRNEKYAFCSRVLMVFPHGNWYGLDNWRNLIRFSARANRSRLHTELRTCSTTARARSMSVTSIMTSKVARLGPSLSASTGS